ncbi:AlpA family transcriptional regulator [Ruegeria sp. THAF57]|uniref:helix-turn-helix transcriptional regulator n=1 Tax=Ruegeria sp. THAF57 TaxID=2744555 RepID=UPI0021056F0A|nr:AlpA family phage regulatory protein [Ruegeria sp. THAF57]
MVSESGLSRSTIYRYSRNQTYNFPPLVKMHERCSGLWREDWDRWLASRPTVHTEDAA